jgi:long-chain acyl-CoA synthetase
MARIRTLADLTRHVAQEFPREVFVGRSREGRNDEYSTQAFVDRVEHLVAGLHELGVVPGDRVAILSPSRPEWTLADLATLSVGGVTVPVYPTLAPAQVRYILQDSGARFIFVADVAQAAKVQEVRHQLPILEAIIVFEPAAGDRGVPASGSVLAFDALAERGRAALSPSLATDLATRRDAISPDDLATLIYTSGTTGDPKGVMLTHANLVSNVIAVGDVIDFTPQDVALSFLPLSHSFERLVVYAYLYYGATTMFAESMDTIARDLLRVRPTFMTGVPRVYEKLHARVLEAVEAGSSFRQRLFHWALGVGGEYARARRAGSTSPLLRLRHAIADRLVFAKVRSRTGGRLRTLVSGSAPLAQTTGEFFEAIGMPIVEGYGLTETSPVLTANPPRANRLGTVGPAIPGVELRMAEDGEILARGPNIMRGYYNRPDATAEVLRDGWLHTGDVGVIDADGYLTITDRKKDLIVTSGGKNVAPQPVEAQLKQHPLVAEAVLIGDRRQFISALVVPAFPLLETRLRALGVTPGNRDAMCEHQQTQALYQEIVDSVNRGLAQYEQIKRFAVLCAEFSIAGGELTPTLKVRRNIVAGRWQNVIDALYKGKAPAVDTPRA